MRTELKAWRDLAIMSNYPLIMIEKKEKNLGIVVSGNYSPSHLSDLSIFSSVPHTSVKKLFSRLHFHSLSKADQEALGDLAWRHFIVEKVIMEPASK